jgi:hypothetical protein
MSISGLSRELFSARGEASEHDLKISLQNAPFESIGSARNSQARKGGRDNFARLQPERLPAWALSNSQAGDNLWGGLCACPKTHITLEDQTYIVFSDVCTTPMHIITLASGRLSKGIFMF